MTHNIASYESYHNRDHLYCRSTVREDEDEAVSVGGTFCRLQIRTNTILLPYCTLQ